MRLWQALFGRIVERKKVSAEHFKTKNSEVEVLRSFCSALRDAPLFGAAIRYFVHGTFRNSGSVLWIPYRTESKKRDIHKAEP